MTSHRIHDGIHSGAPTDMAHADPGECGKNGLPCLVCAECRDNGATATTDAHVRKARADRIDWRDRAVSQS